MSFMVITKTFFDMKNKIFALSEGNYLILTVGLFVVIVGFMLMSGDGSTEDAYNPDIFSNMRICVAPIVCLIGYIICGISIFVGGRNASEV